MPRCPLGVSGDARESLQGDSYTSRGRDAQPCQSTGSLLVSCYARVEPLQPREPRNHYGVKIKFGELFVKTGRVDPKFGRDLSRALDLREDADYAIDSRAEVPKEVAEEQFRKASEFLEMAERFLMPAGGNHEAG